MKLSFKVLLYSAVFFGLLYHPCCSSGENCTFDITGTWNITVIWDWDAQAQWPTNLTLTFSGNSTGGAVSGEPYNWFEDNAGAYTVNDCNTVQANWDFYDNQDGCHVIWSWDGTSTSDASMNGRTTLDYSGDENLCGGPTSGTWTATKN